MDPNGQPGAEPSGTPQPGESQWVIEAFNKVGDRIDRLEKRIGDRMDGLEERIDAPEKRTKRIERLLWVLTGAIGFITLLFGDELMAFIRYVLAQGAATP